LQASGGAELRERLLVPAPADAEFTLGPGQVPALGHGLGDPVTGGQRVGVVGTQNPQPGGQYVAVLGLGRGVIAAGGGGSGDTVPGIQSVGSSGPSTRYHLRPPPRHHRPAAPPHDPHQPTALIIINLTHPQAICPRPVSGITTSRDSRPAKLTPQGKRDLLRH
jgi:hypothetical protein